MTIMSDNWITKMAREENMIAPFVDGQKKMELFLMEFLRMDMMHGYQVNLKFLLI